MENLATLMATHGKYAILGITVGLLIKLMSNSFYNQRKAGYIYYSKNSGFKYILIFLGTLCIVVTVCMAFENWHFSPALFNSNNVATGWLLIISGYSKEYTICENGLILDWMKVGSWDKFESYYWQYEPYSWIGVDENKIYCNLQLKSKTRCFLMSKREIIDLEIPLRKKEMLTNLFLIKFHR